MTRIRLLAILSTLLLGASCSSSSDQPDNCEDGKCDDFAGVCPVIDFAGSTDPACDGSTQDNDGRCHGADGRFIKKECCAFGNPSVVKRNDELAKRIINEGDSCPTTFREVIENLKASGCDTLETRVVETSAHHLDAANLSGQALDDFMLFGGQVPETGGYHTVTSMECGGGGAENRILFLQSKQSAEEPALRGADGKLDRVGVSDDSVWEAGGLRKSMEVIAWDPTGGPEVDGEVSGVFNYYALEASDESSETCKTFGRCNDLKWAFHGNSAQYLDLDENLEPTGEFFAQKRRCAECHTGGGIIMRELNSPWINWEEDFDTLGARELMRAHADVLGDDIPSSAGANQEFTIVGDGNDLWNRERIKIANSPDASRDPNSLLKPLFCSVEVNVQTSFSQSISSISNDFFFDPMLSSKTGQRLRVSMANQVYQDVISEGQVIPRLTNGTTLSPLDAPFVNVPGFGIIDTAGAFMFPERSGADQSYVRALENAEIIDDTLIRAVLGVDFTRPIFSETRCGVLAELDLTWEDLGGTITDETTVRTAIQSKLEALKADGSLSEGGVELLDNLGDVGAVATRMEAFSSACESRGSADQEALMTDILHVANVMREKAYDLPIYQLIPSSMPSGVGFNIGLGPLRPSSGHTANARLNAADCSLESLEQGQ